jgi:hypothetical protein
MKKIIVFCYCIVTLVITPMADCFSQTRAYCPTSEEEEALLKDINKSITPNRAAENIELYQGTAVGWAGMVKAYSPNSGDVSIMFMIEHRYYNWIEIIETSQIQVPLLREGDRDFVVEYEYDATNSKQSIIDGIRDGRIKYVIVYGKPSGFDYLGKSDGSTYTILRINMDYIRFLDTDSVFIMDEYINENVENNDTKERTDPVSSEEDSPEPEMALQEVPVMAESQESEGIDETERTVSDTTKGFPHLLIGIGVLLPIIGLVLFIMHKKRTGPEYTENTVPPGQHLKPVSGDVNNV